MNPYGYDPEECEHVNYLADNQAFGRGSDESNTSVWVIDFGISAGKLPLVLRERGPTFQTKIQGFVQLVKR